MTPPRQNEPQVPTIFRYRGQVMLSRDKFADFGGWSAFAQMTHTKLPVAESRQITIPSNIVEQIELALETVPGVTLETFVLGSLAISARDAISDTDWLLAVLQETVCDRG